jgi:hypothetical protein
MALKVRDLIPAADALGFNATETGQQWDVSDRMPGSTWAVLVAGTFVATIKVEASNDGTNWAQIGADVTTTGTSVTSAAAVKMIRARCSAFTSGAAFASLAYDIPGR